MIPAHAQAREEVAATFPRKELYPTNHARRLRYLGGPRRCVQKYKPPLTFVPVDLSCQWVARCSRS